MKKNSQNQNNPIDRSYQILAQEQAPARKRAGFAGGFFLGVLVFLALAAGLALVIWFDLFGLKHDLALFMQLDQVEAGILLERSQELARQEQELQVLKADLDQKESWLQEQERAILRQEDQLADWHDELDRRAEHLAGKEAELADLVSLYETMAPEQAAAILAIQEDPVLTGRILSQMSQTRLSMILSQLPPQTAAELIGLISRSS